MKTLDIGDIHGCLAEFLDLLELVALSNDDQIIALGDIVDRGPDSVGVLDFFRSRSTARTVMGNHERKHVRAFRGEVGPALSQTITRRQLGEIRYGQDCDFMWSLPRYIDLPEALLVHGFFEPGVQVGDQREVVIVGTLTGEHYLQKQFRQPWYELYDGDKPIVAGHHNYTHTREPLIVRDRVFCIDTGCCYGNALTGLILPEFRIVSVPSRKNYWAEIRGSLPSAREIVEPGLAIRTGTLEWEILRESC